MKARKGQVLVVAALAIALTILSVQSYLYSLSKQRITPQNDYLSEYLLSIKQGSKHTIAASLVNISNSGVSTNLASNLARWTAFLVDDYQFGTPVITITLETSSPYSDGLRFEWGATGTGISSACSDFNLSLSGRDVEVNWDYSVNITSKVTLRGEYTDLGGTSKRFDLIVNVYNEREPCLAAYVILHYNKTTTWENPTNLMDYYVTDYGNGTYMYSFTDDLDKTQIPVRIQVVDLRGVYIRVEQTLVEN